MASTPDTFDYVIVGAGAAGSILAARLTEDPGVTVCVLGRAAGPQFLHPPAGGFIKTLVDPSVTWQFKTEPTERTGGRDLDDAGAHAGGSSSVNGMIYNRGQPGDLNSWAQRGNRGWGYEDCLPYYMRTEQRIGFGRDDRRGKEGGLPVTDMDWIHPLSEAFSRAASRPVCRATPTTTAATRRGSGISSAASAKAGGSGGAGLPEAGHGAAGA